MARVTGIVISFAVNVSGTYVPGFVNMELSYRHNAISTDLECYSDTDFGSCPDTHCSKSGVWVTSAGAAITWNSGRKEQLRTQLVRKLLTLISVDVNLMDWEAHIRA